MVVLLETWAVSWDEAGSRAVFLVGHVFDPPGRSILVQANSTTRGDVVEAVSGQSRRRRVPIKQRNAVGTRHVDDQQLGRQRGRGVSAAVEIRPSSPLSRALGLRRRSASARRCSRHRHPPPSSRIRGMGEGDGSQILIEVCGTAPRGSRPALRRRGTPPKTGATKRSECAT